MREVEDEDGEKRLEEKVILHRIASSSRGASRGASRAVSEATSRPSFEALLTGNHKIKGLSTPSPA
jgi:hypothetical protein